jgi:hypothetical protein
LSFFSDIEVRVARERVECSLQADEVYGSGHERLNRDESDPHDFRFKVWIQKTIGQNQQQAQDYPRQWKVGDGLANMLRVQVETLEAATKGKKNERRKGIFHGFSFPSRPCTCQHV